MLRPRRCASASRKPAIARATALPLGVVNPNPALFANRLHLLRDRVEPERAVQNTGTEVTEVVLVPVADLEGLLVAGEIDHALVAAHVVALLAPAQAALMAAGARRRRAGVPALVSDFLLRRSGGPRAAQHRRVFAGHSGDGERRSA